MNNSTSTPGDRKLFRGKAIKILELDAIERALDGFTKLVAEHPKANKSMIIFDFYHPDKIASVPADATPFFRREPAYSILFALRWVDPSFDASARQISRDLAAAIDGGKHISNILQGGYANYMDEDATAIDRAKGMFGENYARMQDVKKKYDKNVLFNKWFPITPSA